MQNITSDSKWNRALVGLRVFAVEDLDCISEIVEKIMEGNSLEKISSIYKIKRMVQEPRHIHDLRSLEMKEGLAFALLVKTSKSPQDFLKFLSRIEVGFSSEVLHRYVDIDLLLYENEISMNPEVTLPHPEFHSSPEEVIPSAEICGEWEHPILQKSVRELAEPFKGQDWGEFFNQGESIYSKLKKRQKVDKSVKIETPE